MTALGVGLLARGAERRVSRRPLRGAVPHAVLAVRHADRLPEQPAPRAVAHRVRPNPMAGVVEGFRWALLGTGTAPGPMLAVSSRRSPLLLLVGGALYFRRDGAHLRGRGVAHGRSARSASTGSGKQYRIRAARQRYKTLRDSIVRRPCARSAPGSAATRRQAGRDETIWALRDVSFEVEAAARSSASSGATAPARARCSRSSRASPSRPRAAARSTGASARCSRWAPGSIPS